MLSGDKEQLEDFLVHILSQTAAATAEQLIGKLKEQRLAYSVQAVYKELRKLQAQGVVIKARGLYSLRLSWIFNLTDLADRAYATYIDAPFPDELLPPSKKKAIWKFSNLLRADNFYLQILTKLLLDPSVRSANTVIDHPWFLFLQGKDESKFQRILEQQRKHQYVLIENNTPLDRLQVKFWDSAGEHKAVIHTFSNDLDLSRTASITTFIGEYVVQERLPAATKKAFDELYRRTRSLRDLNYEEIIRLCTMPSQASVILEKNAVKAQKWWKKISEYF